MRSFTAVLLLSSAAWSLSPPDHAVHEFVPRERSGRFHVQSDVASGRDHGGSERTWGEWWEVQDRQGDEEWPPITQPWRCVVRSGMTTGR